MSFRNLHGVNYYSNQYCLLLLITFGFLQCLKIRFDGGNKRESKVEKVQKDTLKIKNSGYL